ncbi:MAG: hypothetical protein OEV94_05730 [Deltaproteobacteria bacterium]|nr:hypothetical protein [Deltaproteobacteria bacterium]
MAWVDRGQVPPKEENQKGLERAFEAKNDALSFFVFPVPLRGFSLKKDEGPAVRQDR